MRLILAIVIDIFATRGECLFQIDKPFEQILIESVTIDFERRSFKHFGHPLNR